MKKLLLLCALIISTLSVQSQCTVVSSIVNSNNSCDGACNGTIAIAFSGGTLPMSLYLFDGSTTIGPMTVTSFWQFGNLCPGSYTITLIDANNDTCPAINFNIISTPSPDVTVASTNATCSTCNDGAATITGVTGGTPPYSYNWSNGAVGSTIINLSPGTYNVWVVDANGCVDVDTFQIGVGASGFYTVGGQVYYDANSNGAKDIGEPGIGNQNVLVTPGGVNAITNSNGDYAVVVAPGTYDVAYQSMPGWNLTSSPAVHSATVSGSSIGALDFGLFPDSTSGSAVISLTSGFPRCFWNVPYYITVNNTGFTALTGSILFTHDPLLTFLSSSVTPASQIGNQLSYTFTNLGPGQTLTIVVTLTEPAGGTSLLSTLSLNATDMFSNQFALNSSFTQLVSCSYDPNDKQVTPEGQGQLNYVTMDEWLTYKIRFQNTGTDTAFRVVIIDTLDTFLDLNTFTLLGSSHPVQVSMRAGNEVSFIHDNILLPDSNVNEPASHGYVLYRIKGLSTNPDPTSVYNTAYIYFDLNSPVQTNTTYTTFSDNWLGLSENENSQFELFPNPFSESATLRLKNAGNEVFDVRIFDVTGRQVTETQSSVDGVVKVTRGGLMAGVYFVEVRVPGGMEMMKIIVR